MIQPRLAVAGLSLALALTGLAAAAPAGTERAHASSEAIVTHWIEEEFELIAANAMNPPRAARALALLSVAVQRAERAAPPGRKSAAVGAAATTVLAHLFPDDRAQTAGGGPGSEAGRAVARQVVTRARKDGSDQVWTGQPPVGPEFWVPTPPAFQETPLEPLAGTWRPWNLRSPSVFRPPPPPRPGSPRFEAELREVYEVSQTLTDEQRRIAAHWADGAGTVTPPGHWNQIALELIRSRELGARAAATVLAVLNTAQADAFIACWDAKFAYWSLRPVTAIRRALDPDWLPYITTPPFPAYTSGHATTSAAAAEVLASFFPGAAGRLRAAAREAADSRLYGGIHFSSDNAAGLELGARVAKRALTRSG